MFTPTHMFHFGVGSSNNAATFPEGVPVVRGEIDEQGYSEWLSDDEGNVAGYTQGFAKNEFGSYVYPIK